MTMNPFLEHDLQQTRRQFFGNTGVRLGGFAMGLLAADAARGNTPASRVHPPLPGMPHFPPKAKALIYLHMNGAPSQLDLWDYKPQLRAHFDRDLPDSVRMGQRLSTMTSGQARFPVAPSKFRL